MRDFRDDEHDEPRDGSQRRDALDDAADREVSSRSTVSFGLGRALAAFGMQET
jgi:hypothetical protein